MNKSKHYLDACVLIGFLNEEENKYEECKNIIEAAESGFIEAFTSELTGAELVKVKSTSNLSDEEMEQIIATTLNWPWLQKIAFERDIAKISRHLCRSLNLKPMDASHLATAIKQGVDYFDTFDGKFFQSNFPSAVGFPPRYSSVKIQRPLAHGYTPRII